MFREEDCGPVFDPTQRFETESCESEASDNQFWPVFEQKKLEIEDLQIQNTSLPHQDNQLSITKNAGFGSLTMGTRDFEEKRSPPDEPIGAADPVEEDEVATADPRRLAVLAEPLIEEAPQIQPNTEGLPQKESIILTSENKTTKHNMYKGSRSEELEGNREEFVVNLVNKIRKVRGKNYEVDLNKIECTLQEDFSFYLNLRSYRNQEEYTMAGLKSTDDALHNIRNNITKYFTTEKFLTSHKIGGATRRALKILKKSSEGPKRMKDADVDRIWEVIGEDHQLIINYFDDMTENFLYEYLQSNFERTAKALEESLKVGASLSNLSSDDLQDNLSDLVKNTFDSYVEELKLSQFRPENDQLSSDLKDEIIEYVTVETEAPQAIWFMGFCQAVKNQVFSYLKQKLCKLDVYGEKQDDAKKSRKGKKQDSAKKSKKVKKE